MPSARKKLPGLKPRASGGSSIAQHTCKTCQKVFQKASNLRRHQKIHQRSLQCDRCAYVCARPDQLERHKHKQHQINCSDFICFIKGCKRARFGLKTEEALKQHLKHCHRGATMAENDRAAEKDGN